MMVLVEDKEAVSRRALEPEPLVTPAQERLLQGALRGPPQSPACSGLGGLRPRNSVSDGSFEDSKNLQRLWPGGTKKAYRSRNCMAVSRIFCGCPDKKSKIIWGLYHGP